MPALAVGARHVEFPTANEASTRIQQANLAMKQYQVSMLDETAKLDTFLLTTLLRTWFKNWLAEGCSFEKGVFGHGLLGFFVSYAKGM